MFVSMLVFECVTPCVVFMCVCLSVVCECVCSCVCRLDQGAVAAAGSASRVLVGELDSSAVALTLP